MKTLVLLAILGTFLLIGCGENPVTDNKVQTDNVIQGIHYPTIDVTTSNGIATYKYEKIEYEYDTLAGDWFLKIALANCQGGGCGISIEMSSIIKYETFK